MPTDSWTQALCVTPPVICGRALRPFSLSHSVLLRALGNPYAVSGMTAEARHLMQAVDVCSRTHGENVVALFGDLPPSWLRQLVWRARWRGLDFATADASFRVYVGDYTRTAPRQDGDTGDWRKVAVPVEYVLHRVLCCEYGADDAAAWDYGYGYARALYDAWAAGDGDDKLQSFYDQELAALMRVAESAVDGGRDEAWARVHAFIRDGRTAA